jgi:hypothetical protein
MPGWFVGAGADCSPTNPVSFFEFFLTVSVKASDSQFDQMGLTQQ